MRRYSALITLHYTNYTTPQFTTLNTLQSYSYNNNYYYHYSYNTNCNYTTLHYTHINYIILHDATLQLQLQLQLQLDLQLQLHYTTLITLHYNYNSTTLQLQLQLNYNTLHPAVVGEVTTAAIASTPKSTTPTTFPSISGFALPSMHHNNSPLL